MAAVTITAQNTRLDDAETTTDWGSDGGGPGRLLETDFKYQASNCVARKGATASRGIFLSDNVNSDLSGAGTFETVMFKFICTTPGLLDLLSVPGMQLRVGSGSIPASPSSNYHSYDVQGSDTYPLDKSWLILPIDPNIASHRTATTGTPDLTNVDYYALQYDQTAVSKSPNQAMDAVDIGAGLTLAGGDGADTDGVWQDFSDADWGTVANRYGYVREVDGAPNVFLVFGMLVVGTSAATGFNDTARTLIFPDGLFAAGFSGITVDLQNGTTDIDFIDSNFFGKGTEAGEDTRPVLIVTSTTSVFDANSCVFDVFASFTLTSACTFTDCKVTTSGLIDCGSGADLNGTSVLTSAVAANLSAIEWDVNLDPDGELDDMTFSKGTNAHHAVEFGLNSPLTMTIRGWTTTGFNSADANNDSTFHFKRTTGTVTMNIVGGTGNFSFRTDGATINIVTGAVTTLISVDDNTGADLQNARVFVRAASGGPEPHDVTVTITRSGTVATVSHTTHGLAINDKFELKGITDKIEDNVIQTIVTVPGANSYTYATTNSGSTSYTGTILSTAVFIDGLTDVNGDVSDSRVFASNQPIDGFVRKASASPRFKSFGLSGNTIDSTNGVTINIRMVLDE